MTQYPAPIPAIHAGLQSAVPDGALTISGWAETYRYIPLESVANPSLAGRWKNSTTPYLVAIMDAVNDPTVNEILFIASSQVGKTETANNIIGYYIHIDPAKIIYCAETEPKAEAWGIEKFDPMVAATPVLTSRVDPPTSRTSGNTTKRKRFKNGMLNIVHASSPSELSSRPARVIILDEEDAYLPTREGSATSLVEARMKTAGDQKKLIRITTPRTKELSPIYVAWQNSTQEKYFVPCPHCGTYQVLNWRNNEGGFVKWDSEEAAKDAYYVCEQGCEILHDEKPFMLARGEWRVTKLSYKGNRRSFWINEIYSPFTTWGDMAIGWLEANQAMKEHRDPSKLQVFLNTRLAQWWEEIGETVDYQNLDSHIEEYDAEVPTGVLCLTAATDVQGNRLECEVQGWSRDRENWRIAYFVLYGDPALPAVWESLYDVLDAEYETANGVMKISAATVDTGGHYSTEAYKFCKANAGRRWFAVKGSSTAGKPIISKPSRNNRFGVRLFLVGTDTAKDTIFGQLQVDEPGPGYCHFPADPAQGEQYDTKYFQQLCSEKKIIKYTGGQPKPKYVKIGKQGETETSGGKEITATRNEALDIAVYNLAALEILNPSFKALAKRIGNLPAKQEKNGELPEKNDTVTRNNPNPHGVSTFRSGGGWTSNY